MRYPITPEFISELPNKLAAIYIRLETFILEDICERLKTSGTVTETAIEQIKTLQRRGYTFANIEKAVKETLELSDREYENLWNDAVERNKKYFDAVIDKNTLAAASFDKKTFEDEINAIERQTAGELKNITQSLGFAVRQGGSKVTFLPVAETYQKVLDDALMKVQSGTGSYNTAIREAVKQLTDSGLQVIDYQTGWHNRVDVAVRRAVMTGVSQLSAKYSEREAEILGADLFEVSAHKGARDTDKPNPWSNHKAWQGKVYSRSGKSDLYPSIISVCGLGQPDGLTGINCRHMYFPFIEGVSERTYTDKELENIDGEPFVYQGKTYTAYEATQKQRQIETAIRQCKRECIAADAREDREYYTDCSVRLRRLKDEYNSFSKAAKLPMQSERANIAEFGAKEAKEAINGYNEVAKQANMMYDTGSTESNVTAYMRDLPLRNEIKNSFPHIIDKGQQNKHISGTNEYKQYNASYIGNGQFGPSRITIDEDNIKALVSKYAGNGLLKRDKNGKWLGYEIITINDMDVGVAVNNITGEEAITSVFKIKWSKGNGYHIYPDYPSKKGRKTDI